MKSQKQAGFYLTILTGFLFLLSGCATSMTQTRVTPYGNPNTYSVTDPAAVRIFRGFPPQKFIRLGEVEINAPTYAEISVLGLSESPSTLETRLRQSASQMGGDAVVIMEDRPVGTTGGGFSFNQNQVGNINQTSIDARGPQDYGRRVYGVVIKFVQ